MVSIRADKHRNRLYVKYEGFVGPSDTLTAVRRFQEELNKLIPGFNVIADVSELKTLAPENKIILKKIMTIIGEKGVARVIRFVGMDKKNVVLFAQLDRELNSPYPVHFATTQEQVEHIISGKVLPV